MRDLELCKAEDTAAIDAVRESRLRLVTACLRSVKCETVATNRMNLAALKLQLSSASC